MLKNKTWVFCPYRPAPSRTLIRSRRTAAFEQRFAPGQSCLLDGSTHIHPRPQSRPVFHWILPPGIKRRPREYSGPPQAARPPTPTPEVPAPSQRCRASPISRPLCFECYLFYGIFAQARVVSVPLRNWYIHDSMACKIFHIPVVRGFRTRRVSTHLSFVEHKVSHCDARLF